MLLMLLLLPCFSGGDGACYEAILSFKYFMNQNWILSSLLSSNDEATYERLLLGGKVGQKDPAIQTKVEHFRLRTFL